MPVSPPARPALLALALLAACGGTESRTESPDERLDLTVALAPGQARAGHVADERAFWGGISAEARVGDVKLYNDRVRFAIQAPRDGSYYIPQGGHVIDADIVRPAGAPGRDLVDEWVAMAGIGRMLDVHRVEIVDDGRDSGVAVVRATGGESPLELLEGAIEAPGALVPDLGLKITHTYRLPADSWLLEVTTEIEATDTEASFNPGDAILGAVDAAHWWGPGRGYAGADNIPRPWSANVGMRNEGAVALMSGSTEPLGTAGVQALSELLEVAAGFSNEPVVLQPGETMSWTRYYGVGPDLATLSDAWQEATGQATEVVQGVVENPDGPVAGARVTVVIDDEPFTMAVTDESGAWSARVPTGSTVTTAVDGRGTGLFFDQATAAPVFSPYLTPSSRTTALRALESGDWTPPLAEGLGTTTDDGTLGLPARLTVIVDDGLPFEVRLEAANPNDDERLYRPRNGRMAGWTADGEVTLQVEPGSYTVIAHRGLRYERVVDTIELAAGETTLPVSLPPAFEHPGWLLGDPHVHASPSPDGEVAMEHRLMEMAGVGMQLHFGTDHDHVADYTGLLEPLGLQEVLNTVVATEMSPVARGHLNLYPLDQRDDLPNGGGWAWWRNPVENTEQQMAALRDRHGGPLTPNSGFVIQSNHPDAGLLNFAGWRVGEIRSPDYWSDDLDAIEVLNAANYEEPLEMYLDLVNRGHAITPTGVSDSHSLFSGGPGFNGTFIGMGSDDPRDYTPDALREAFAAQRTIVSLGLFLDLSIDPGSTVVGPQTLEVTALGASWATPTRLELYRDGELVETLEAAEGSFELAPDADAAYVVMAAGDTSMAPLYSHTPWAMAAAIKVDMDGDGWTPPLPPLLIEE